MILTKVVALFFLASHIRATPLPGPLYLELQINAAPLPGPNRDFVVIHIEPSDSGNLTWYGLAPGAESVEPLGCSGTNDVVCSGSNKAQAQNCRNLIGVLKSHSRKRLPVSPRSVCFDGEGSQCCVSWHNPSKNLLNGMLVPAAKKSLNVCNSNELVSAKAGNVNLNGVCTSQCLSNRPTHC